MTDKHFRPWRVRLRLLNENKKSTNSQIFIKPFPPRYAAEALPVVNVAQNHKRRSKSPMEVHWILWETMKINVNSYIFIAQMGRNFAVGMEFGM
jgi:hypothetical protein